MRCYYRYTYYTDEERACYINTFKIEEDFYFFISKLYIFTPLKVKKSKFCWQYVILLILLILINLNFNV